MYEKVYSNPDIYLIKVPLSTNPLTSVNSYVIKTPEKNLIIDTGLAVPECLKALQTGLRDLNIDLSKTELFITHLHSDHAGLAFSLLKENSTVYMSPADFHIITRMSQKTYMEEIYQRCLHEGFSQKEMKHFQQTIDPDKLIPDQTGTVSLVTDQSKIQVGAYEFTCIETPGHTPGHTCLYLEKEKLIFLGDHILFDISPSIPFWAGIRDSLGDYLNSLRKVRQMGINKAFVGHRKSKQNLGQRIDALIQHHEARLKQIRCVVKHHEGLNAYEIAKELTWSVKAHNWGDFTIQQKWFAVAETIAHLDYLVLHNGITRQEVHSINQYYFN